MDVRGSKVSRGNEVDHNLRSTLGDVVPLFPKCSNLVFCQSLGVHRRNGWSYSTDSDENDATNSVDIVVSGPIQIERALKLGSTPVDLRSTSQEEPLSGERVHDRDLRGRVLPQVANGPRGADVGPDHRSIVPDGKGPFGRHMDCACAGDGSNASKPLKVDDAPNLVWELWG